VKKVRADLPTSMPRALRPKLLLRCNRRYSSRALAILKKDHLGATLLRVEPWRPRHCGDTTLFAKFVRLAYQTVESSCAIVPMLFPESIDDPRDNTKHP